MRAVPYPRQLSVSLWLIIVNTACYAAQLILPLATQTGGSPRVYLESYLALTPADLAHGYVWQLITFQFLHGGFFHLIINCAMLYMFGRPVEDVMGRATFLKFYLGAGAFGGLLQAIGSWVFPGHFGMGPVIGASAGVFALIAAFAALNWEQPLTLLLAFIIPVTMRAKYLILVEIILATLGMLQPRSGIAHAAHLGGILAGLAFVRFGLTRQTALFNWSRLRAALPRRELVKTTTTRQAVWRRAKKEDFDDIPSAEFISREVDPILDKISEHGIQSLTARERRILEAARAKMEKP